MFLEVITGPMFSGKSEELLRRLRRAAYAGKSIVVIKPGIDDRKTRSIFNLIRNDEKLKDYRNLSMDAVNSAEKFEEAIAFGPELLVIDEAQFFDNAEQPADKWFAKYIADLLFDAMLDMEIIVVGLDMDAWRKPFGAMPELMARADVVTKLTAICLRCKGENGPAIFTQKNTGSKEQIEVGDTETYEARCRICHMLPPK